MNQHRLSSRALRMFVLAAAMASAAPAAAQAPAAAPSAAPAAKGAEAEAEKRFLRGVELHSEGDFAQALVEFRRAYETAPNYRVLFNIGEESFQLGDYAGALRALEKYLADGGEAIPAEKRQTVGKDIEKLRQRVGKVQVVVAESGAEVLVDDAPVGVTPMVDALLVTAGRRKITVTKGSQTVTRIVEVATGETVRVDLELASAGPAQTGAVTAPAVVPVTEAPRSNLVWLPWAATGLLAIGTGVTGGLALSASGDLKKQRETLGSTQEERTSQQSQVKTLALVTDILGAAAIVGLGVSIIVTATRSSAPASASVQWLHPLGGGPAAPHLTPGARLSAGPGGLRITGHF